MSLFEGLFGKPDLNDFEMTETMWGYVAEGANSFKDGYEIGKQKGNKLQYVVTAHVDNFKQFKVPSNRRARMTGWVTCQNLYGEKLPIRNGEYGLYTIDRETGQRQITYKFNFTGKDGVEYFFSGYKVIVHDEAWDFDIFEDQTTLFATITKTEDGNETVAARGIIHYHVEDFPEMLLSIRTPKNDTIVNRVRMATKFFAFVTKELSEYTREINPFYKADYTNFICRGVSQADGENVEFFFFSGAHDKGFPWGDNVSFADIGLVLREGDTWRRFALTEYAIEVLKHRISEGIYQYEGPIYELSSGYQVSFEEMHQADLPSHIRKVNAKFSLRFTSKEIDTKNLPFDLDSSKLGSLPKELKKRIEQSQLFKALKKGRDDLTAFGYTTQIYRLTKIDGDFVVDGVRYSIQTDRTLGEGEIGKLAGPRRPKLYYNYFCAIEPEADLFRVHVRSGVLKTLSADPLVSKSEQIMGDIIGQISRMDLLVKGEQQEDMEKKEADRFIVPQEDLLEINNDQYPTATFQRRVVALPGTNGSRVLALEEDMHVINLESVKSDKTATVAAIKDPDRFRALDQVLEETGFFTLLDEAQSNSGKAKDGFSIIIKPNFSFMYSLTDISTYTDPSLVEHLIDRIFEKGYRNIAVAEAQSTYAAFFTNRDVPTLAKYIGLRGKNYKVIDLSENTEAYDYGRTLGNHKSHPVWRDADFRISFAKNKTHSYAFYTLTIKNIYGALPMKNKFKEYHCNKKLGIYKPAIDFIEEFPIHFGLIDAYFSADGLFGIFADVEPNFTSTIIGGTDIVAVDWVGASKMGYDPMISEYMQLAVDRFGKPKIRMIGDHTTYTEWKNVPKIISKAAFGILDQDFLFGDFLYSAVATMDPFFTFKPDDVSRKIARLFTTPMRKLLFEWVRGNKEELTRDDLKKLLDRDQWEYMDKLIKALLE